jgi:hypothetical protein
MLTAVLGAPNQRGRRGHVATLAAVIVLSLAACVDLTPPGNNEIECAAHAADAMPEVPRLLYAGCQHAKPYIWEVGQVRAG